MIFIRDQKPSLISVQKIWSFASHNALTDLIRFNDLWFCTFRESDSHVGGQNGIIRILTSQNGQEWLSSTCLDEIGVDLRDPKLSITPDGKLMLLLSGAIYEGSKYISSHTRVSFSENGFIWTSFLKILQPHEWLWRITWNEENAYGVSYSFSEPTNRKSEWLVNLYRTIDGLNYDLITNWPIKGHPNETTLRFLPNGDMVALLRREKNLDDKAWIGHSSFPYTKWDWKTSSYHVGGPNFLVMPSGKKMIAGGRFMLKTPWIQHEKTAIALMDFDDLRPLLYLPSEGDCSYPGMVFHEGVLWMSYYSSHEENTAVYLAKIFVPDY